MSLFTVKSSSEMFNCKFALLIRLDASFYIDHKINNETDRTRHNFFIHLSLQPDVVDL